MEGSGMGGEDDGTVELRRQLEMVRRRVDQAVGRLARARDGLAVTSSVGSETGPLALGDLHLLCVRLEVALIESAEAAEKLAAELRELPESAPPGVVSQSAWAPLAPCNAKTSH